MPTTGRSRSQAGGSGSRMVVRSRSRPGDRRATPSASESTSSEIGTTRISSSASDTSTAASLRRPPR